MDYEEKGKQGIELLKESVFEVIKQKGAAGGTEIARSISALRFDIEKDNHKAWFTSNIIKLLEKDGRVQKVNRKWCVK